MFGQYIVDSAIKNLMLGVGQPSPDILLKASSFINYNIDDCNVLQYGIKNGFEQYRFLVQKLIEDFANIQINSDDIYMTNGITQAVFMLASLLKSIDYDTIYVEDLTYFIMINIFKDLKFIIKPFKLTNLKKLQAELDNDIQNGRKSIIYLIPFCNNPTGLTMKQSELEELLLCLKNSISNTIVISDETYQFLHYKTNTNTNTNTNTKSHIIPNIPLATYSSNIISLGTFSKILAPGVRLGWIYTKFTFNSESNSKSNSESNSESNSKSNSESNSESNLNINQKIKLYDWLDNTGFMDSGGSVNPVMAYMITENILANYTNYKLFLSEIVYDLEKKSNLLISHFKKYPDYFEVINPDGGYFILVQSRLITSNELFTIAKDKFQFMFHEANKFSIEKNYNYSFRISVSYYSFDDLEKYFLPRLDNLVKYLDTILYKISPLKLSLELPVRIPISLFGNGKLGMLIKDNLIKENIFDYKMINREFNKDNFSSIIVDVTSPQGTIDLINYCMLNFKKENLPKLIIGTTGHNEEQMSKIKEYSSYSYSSTSVIYCSNFSNGIQNLIKLINNLTFDVLTIEIIDIHHIHKKDMPSGTAKLLKNELEKIYPKIDINIKSERIGEEIGTHEIILYGYDENIKLTHIALDRNIFAKGCIDLIKKLYS
jgi:4-hydroxy-tetrahydrodipicolinate reductase